MEGSHEICEGSIGDRGKGSTMSRCKIVNVNRRKYQDSDLYHHLVDLNAYILIYRIKYYFLVNYTI